MAGGTIQTQPDLNLVGKPDCKSEEPASERRRCQRPVLVLAVILAAYLILESFIPLRTAVQIGADEGFELAKATLCLHGQHLYTDVWNDQPPLHTFLVTQILRYISPSILGPRLLTVGFALLLLGSIFKIVHRVSGLSVAALTTGFVIASPGFLELSSSCMLEIPALATALAAVSLLFNAPRGEWSVREIAAGIVFGLALQIKLVPAIYLVLVPLIVLLRSQQQLKSLKTLLVPLVAFGSSLLVAYVGTDLLIEGGAYLGNFGQSWASHFGHAKTLEYGSANDFPFQWPVLLKNWDVAAPGLIGLAVLLRKLRPILPLPLTWLVIVFGVFAFHKPWWPYYYIHTAIPLCWCAALGVGFLYQRVKARMPLLTIFFLFSACVSCWMGARIYFQVNNIRKSPKTFSSPVMAQIQRFKPFSTYMYADKLIYSFYCDIPIIPQLAVVPIKRVWAGEITNDRIVKEMLKYRPGLILLLNDARELPFNDLLQAEYQPVYMDKESRLYAHKSIAKSPHH